MSSNGVVMTLILSAHIQGIPSRSTLPIDVADVEDLAEIARDLGVIRSYEFRLDAGLSQISSHGEISDCSDHGNRSRDVVKDTVRARLGEG